MPGTGVLVLSQHLAERYALQLLGDDAQARMAGALNRAGVATASRGAMLTVDAVHGQLDVHDLIRDTASDLGLGLVRLQVDHRHIEDVFAVEASHD